MIVAGEPHNVIDEARAVRADVIALDWGSKWAQQLDQLARHHDIAVVVVPHIHTEPEQAGRGVTFAFQGYERIDSAGELQPIADGGLAAEIESRQRRRT